MESTSIKNHHIQISEATANLLLEKGKAKWTKPREENSAIKGKGNVKIARILEHEDNSTAEIDEDDDNDSNAPLEDEGDIDGVNQNGPTGTVARRYARAFTATNHCRSWEVYKLTTREIVSFGKSRK
mmetsp:Transcript_69247/g.104426  ORF Transcript_69247/g.104426 Transcript_69247/m.104426 type:complete len:127 (+) Transcript_69247:234-614(+)